MPAARRLLVPALLLLLATPLLAQATLAKVKATGQLTCGLNREEPEYSNLDAHGNRALFDVDLCKAVAIAVLGPNARFNVVPFPDEQASLAALKVGTVDLIATATPSLTANAALDLAFGRIMLFDYQALMVNPALGVHAPRDLAGKKVCFLAETDIEVRLQAWAAREKISFIPFPFQEEGEMEAAFLTNNCAAITADATQLAYERIAFRTKGRDYLILPDVIAKDPLATATRGDDRHWSALVNWVEEALVQAEESGITAANVDAMKSTPDLALQLLLGAIPGIGKPLGLDDSWAARIIKGVGSYGEIFERDLGPATPMRLDRGLNRTWQNGGLMIAGPLH